MCKNFGAWPKPPCDRIERPSQGVRRRPPQQPASRSPGAGCIAADGLKIFRQLAGGFVDLGAAVAPRLGQHEQDAAKAAPAVFVFGREVGAAGEGRRSGVRKTVIGQPPWPVMHLHGRHVNLIEVGPFLAVHLDADEVFVEDFGDFFVLKTLMFHDVTPMARRVADAEEDRSVELLGTIQRLRSPRIPIDGVVGVLFEIRTGFVGEVVGEQSGVAHGCWLVEGLAATHRGARRLRHNFNGGRIVVSARRSSSRCCDFSKQIRGRAWRITFTACSASSAWPRRINTAAAVMAERASTQRTVNINRAAPRGDLFHDGANGLFLRGGGVQRRNAKIRYGRAAPNDRAGNSAVRSTIRLTSAGRSRANGRRPTQTPGATSSQHVSRLNSRMRCQPVHVTNK